MDTAKALPKFGALRIFTCEDEAKLFAAMGAESSPGRWFHVEISGSFVPSELLEKMRGNMPADAGDKSTPGDIFGAVFTFDDERTARQYVVTGNSGKTASNGWLWFCVELGETAGVFRDKTA